MIVFHETLLNICGSQCLWPCPTRPSLDRCSWCSHIIWEVCACRAQRRRLLYPFLLLGDQVLSKQREGHLCHEMIKMKLSHSAHPCTLFFCDHSLGMFFGLGIQCLTLLESQWHIHDNHQPKQVSWLAKPQVHKYHRSPYACAPFLPWTSSASSCRHWNALANSQAVEKNNDM